MKAKKKKEKYKIFVQPCHPYRHDIFVSAGATFEQAVAWAKKEELKKDFQQFLSGGKKYWDEVMGDKDKLAYAIESDQKHLILIMNSPKNVWDYLECLIHEISHLVDWLVKYKMLEGETEARAYLTEYLFRSIRITLLP